MMKSWRWLGAAGTAVAIAGLAFACSKEVNVTANGDMRTSFSYENANSVNASEPSPLNLYTKIFGPDYQDPNADGFTPSPRVMARKSVLSGVLNFVRFFGGVEVVAEEQELYGE